MRLPMRLSTSVVLRLAGAVAAQAAAPSDPRFEALPLTRSQQNHLLVRAYINGKPALLGVDSGAPVSADSLPLHLRRARTTRISIEANGSVCRGMLRHRYESSGLGEEEQS